jgi:DNA repair photolyase
MKQYIPNRVIITPEAKGIPFTNEMLLKVKGFNPKVEVIYSTNQKPTLPMGLSDPAKFKYLKETLLLCSRSIAAPFMEVFASPGNIVENLGVIGKIGFHCPLSCQPCYLHVAGRGTPWTRVYVDLDRFFEQADKELYVHNIALTIWNISSLIKKEQFPKVPPHFKNVCDKIVRKDVLSTRNNIGSHEAAIEYLQTNFHLLLTEMGLSQSKSKLNTLRKRIPKLYTSNGKYPLSINIGEYTDIGALEPFTNYVEKCLSWMDEHPDINFRFRTRAPYFNDFSNHPSIDRLTIALCINTDSVLQQYLDSGFSVSELIESAKNIISQGVQFGIALEPIIKYKGYEKEYVALVKLVQKELDLSRINSFNIGTVRYKAQLISTILKYFPTTALLDAAQQLVPPEGEDHRWRYSVDERVNIYSRIIEAFPEDFRNRIKLGSETPDLWARLGMDQQSVHINRVKQYEK